MLSVSVQYNNYYTHLKMMNLTVVLRVCSFECRSLGLTPSFSSSLLKARIFIEFSTSLMAGAKSEVDTNTERYGSKEEALRHVRPKAEKRPCPVCHKNGQRIPDHLAVVHNIRGPCWKPLHERLLRMSRVRH